MVERLKTKELFEKTLLDYISNPSNENTLKVTELFAKGVPEGFGESRDETVLLLNALLAGVKQVSKLWLEALEELNGEK